LLGMWQREQKPSISEPRCASSKLRSPRSKSLAHAPARENGFSAAFAVRSGGDGRSHSPSVDVCRADSRNALRHTGSRHAFDIWEPFHSSKIFWWQVWHWPGWFWVFQNSS